MRPALPLCLAALLAVSPARAETWVHTRDSGSGMPMCFDKDSPKLMPDGLTHWAAKMCQDAVPQLYATDCSKNFKVELVIRIYDVGSTERYREMTVDYPDSGMALDAEMACHKQ